MGGIANYDHGVIVKCDHGYSQVWPPKENH